MWLLIHGLQGHVGRNEEQEFEAHSNPGMAASPRLVSLWVTTCLECRKQVTRENGVVFPGRNKHAVGRRCVHGSSSLPSPQAISIHSLTHTYASTGGFHHL